MQPDASRREDTIAGDSGSGPTSGTDNYAEYSTDDSTDNPRGNTHLTIQTPQLDQVQAAVPAASDMETQPFPVPYIPPPAQMSVDLLMIPTETIVDNSGSCSMTDIPLDPLLFQFCMPPSS